MQGEAQGSWLDRHKSIVIFIGIFLVMATVATLIFVGIKMATTPKENKTQEQASQKEEDDPLKEALEKKKQPGSLPEGEELAEGDKNGDGELADWEVENLSFGDFYKKPEHDIEVGFDDIELPMNIKVDVANYHDINRKIDLESGLDDLNENGFAVLDNPFSAQADDFYTIYDHLDKKQMPTLITADFLLYYYQNVLKSVYKEVESTTFYDNLWETNLKLYKIAKTRYEERRQEAGIVNDPTLEAERLELIFFATALRLLQPTEDQINREATLEATDMFSVGEANHYSFQLPDYLEENVRREVKLIREAEGLHKSPVLLYERDYGIFEVPNNYLDSSRLRNFYLASSWLNSVFSLHYRSEDCPNCLLDKDDWRISFYAAILLAEDFSANQDLQNRWAKIYKLMSYFTGLRGDLTYLHYNNVFKDLFGEDVSATEILSGSEQDIDIKLERMRSELSQFDFLEIEGAIDQTSTSTKPLVGMKMLTEAYWPNDYIIGELTYPKVGVYLEADTTRDVDTDFVKTLCSIDREPRRCLFTVYDMIDLIYPIDDINSYYAANTLYEGYEQQKNKLESQLRDFTSWTWHSNNYWTTLYTAKEFMTAPDSHKPAYARNQAWTKRKLDTVAGAWVNLQVEADILTTYQQTDSSHLSKVDQDNQYAEYRYAEPNHVLTAELLANTEMLLQMFSALDITEKDNQAVLKLKILKKDLENVLAIVDKELAGEELSADDYKFLEAFPKQYSIKREGDKNILFELENSREDMIESVEGVKLLILTYKKGSKNIFTIGPVFDFWEDKD